MFVTKLSQGKERTKTTWRVSQERTVRTVWSDSVQVDTSYCMTGIFRDWTAHTYSWTKVRRSAHDWNLVYYIPTRLRWENTWHILVWAASSVIGTEAKLQSWEARVRLPAVVRYFYSPRHPHWLRGPPTFQATKTGIEEDGICSRSLTSYHPG